MRLDGCPDLILELGQVRHEPTIHNQLDQEKSIELKQQDVWILYLSRDYSAGLARERIGAGQSLQAASCLRFGSRLTLAIMEERCPSGAEKDQWEKNDRTLVNASGEQVTLSQAASLPLNGLHPRRKEILPGVSGAAPGP